MISWLLFESIAKHDTASLHSRIFGLCGPRPGDAGIMIKKFFYYSIPIFRLHERKLSPTSVPRASSPFKTAVPHNGRIVGSRCCMTTRYIPICAPTQSHGEVNAYRERRDLGTQFGNTVCRLSFPVSTL